MLPKLTNPKRLIITAVIVIAVTSIALWYVAANENFLPSPSGDGSRSGQDSSSSDNGNDNENDRSDGEDYYLRGSATLNETAYAEGKQLPVKNERYLCGTPFPSSTQYIQEYHIPLTCSQPVGITTDGDDKIWFVATWSGYLVVFDPDLRKFIDFIEIPNWKTKGTFGSMVWNMEFDEEGNLWFTDQVNDAIWRYFVSEERFEMYRVPTIGSYPQGLSFDNQGKIWFSEIFGKRIGVLDPSKVVDNTTNGITEYPFEDIEYETLGPILISKNYNNTIWFTAVTYPEGGNVISFNTANKNFTVFDLPGESSVPIGVAEDRNGALWINDHATNLFFRFDPETLQVTKYSTSLPTSRNDTTTLPYFNIAADNKIWFNEHEGNAIAYFDMMNSTLVEYQVPTKGVLWGNTSNPLKFTIDDKGSIWFTEWSENKIGVLESGEITNLPLWLTTSKDQLVLDSNSGNGDNIEIFLYPNSSILEEAISQHQLQGDDNPIEVTVATSITPSGKLWNITSSYNNTLTPYLDGDTDFVDGYGNPYTIEMDFEPIEGVIPGNYTLTIGARYDSVTYSKIIDLIIT